MLTASCYSYKPWSMSKQIPLNGVSPIGLVEQKGDLWISDGDHNRMIKTNFSGKMLDSISDFDRPMHISNQDGKLYIPNYGADNIVIVDENKKIETLNLPDTLDAPSGISVVEDEIAIADFYNHRILYFDGAKWISIGEEGHENGDLYYPTDVQIFGDKIYVADAYNNRLQVFNKKGESILLIGEEEKMNASTGVFIASEKELYITDFENNKVNVYNAKGELHQTLSTGLSKPIDLIKTNNKLVVINYKGQSIVIYTKK